MTNIYAEKQAIGPNSFYVDYMLGATPTFYSSDSTPSYALVHRREDTKNYGNL